MKQLQTVLFTCAAFLCLNAGCKKEKITTDSLPPITQTGANTFGCLINGNVFVPKGYVSPHANYRLIIDPTFHGGNFSLRVYMIKQDSSLEININADSLRDTGLHHFRDSTIVQISFYKYHKVTRHEYCGSASYPINQSGYLKITRYDLQNRIFSGEFEAAFYIPDCGYGTPIRITQGRFDKQL